MNNLDIEIYKQVKPTKGLTEIYLGHVIFPWHYALAEYSADRTEGIPFDVFDKVICRLLELDGTMTIVQLGNILGMNIEENVPNGRYRDLAEYEILTEKLQQLIEFGLVESSNGAYHLTRIGKESVTVGRKFRTLSDYEFPLFYDLTGGQNMLARSAFIDAARKESDITTPYDYEDETKIKSFSNHQIVGIYNPQEGNSFSNLRLNEVREYVNSVHFGIIYNFLKKDYRLVCYNPMGLCDLYTEAINLDDSLKERIIQCFLNQQESSSEMTTELQTQFEDNAILTQRYIEYKEYHEQDAALDRMAYKESEEIIVPEDFWNDVESRTLSSKPKRVCFCVDILNIEIIKSIKQMAEKNSTTKFFLAFGQKEDGVNIFDSDNLYLCQMPLTNRALCAIDDKVLFNSGKYVYSYHDHSYQRNVVIRTDPEIESKDIFDTFVRTWVPNYLSDFRQSINGEIADNKGIARLASIEEKLKDFMSYIVELNLSDIYNETISLRNQKMHELKVEYAESLKNELLKLMGETAIESIKNLNEIKSVEEKLASVEKRSYDDYTELRGMISSFNAALKERENFIRDILLAKTYIIDTNIFIDDPEFLSKIKMPNKAVICAKVTDELDKFKIRTKEDSDIHEKASKALRNINNALKKNKGTIVKAKADTQFLPADFTDRSADNLILCVALMYKEKNPCLLTSDNGLQVKAQICDIPTKNIEEFNNMLKAKDAEKAKGQEVENGDVVKTKKVYNNKGKNKYNHKKK